MAALSNLQLKCMIACDSLMRDKIIGVFPADQIRKLESNEGLIINTKPSGHEGEHWLSVYNTGDHVEVFDSFALASNKIFINFQKLAGSLYINKISIQCSDSNVCGYYSVFYLFLKVRNISFQDFLDLFSPMCEMNDAFVIRFIKRTFPLCLTNHVR